MTTEQTKAFILAGKAIFTLSNGRSGDAAADYTYLVTKKHADNGFGKPIFFVKLLTGPNNLDDYTYVGILDATTGRVRLTAKSVYTADSKPVVALGWALGHVWAGRELPGGATLQHAGRCGKCGDTLTVPESIERGLGPDCSGLGYTKPRNEARKPRAKRGEKQRVADLVTACVEAVRATEPDQKVACALACAFQIGNGDRAGVTDAIKTFGNEGVLTLGELLTCGKQITQHFAAVAEATVSHQEAA